MSISNRALRSLREELILVVTNSEKNLENMSINEIQKMALNNKKKKIEEE